LERADLHFHSNNSDGKHSIEELSVWLEEQSGAGLKLAVLTDHDGCEGFPAFEEASAGHWPAIRACELSCELEFSQNRRSEIHLLIFGIQNEDNVLKGIFERFREDRKRRYFGICKKLEEAGYAVATDKIANAHKGVLGRPHVADALIEAGTVQSRQEAFDRFLTNRSKYLVPKWRVPVQEALSHSRRLGYRTSLAHPGIYGIQERHLETLKEMGLDAVELVHPKHGPAEEEMYRDIAQKLDLFESGGSDFHDARSDFRNGFPSLGRAPYSYDKAKEFLSPFL